MTNWNPTGWIKGRLTLDADGNDNEWNDDTQSWDQGLAGKTIKLLDLHGNVVATSVTDGNGWYMFDVPPGDYKVMFPKPDGYMFSAKDSGVDEHYDSDANENGMTDVISVWAGETIHNVDAGLKPKPHDPDCIVIEAEDMHLNGFKAVDGNHASGGELVKLWDAQGSGDLSTHFNGPDGHYDLTVFVQDESDGQGSIKVKVNGHVVDTIHLNRDSDGGGSNNAGFSAFTLEGVEVNNGDKIVLWVDGDDHGYEFARIDKIELKPGEKPNDPPDAIDDCITVHEDEGANDNDGNVLTNDTDADGDQLFVTGVAGSTNNVGVWVDLDKGRVKINQDGSIDFDAAGDFDNLNDGESEDVFVMYDISDGNGGQDWAKLKITVDGKSPPPADPDCIVIEAEDFTLYNFKVVDGSQASGGKLVKLWDAKGSGDLHKHFEGPDGCYEFSIFVQDESDGQSTIKVKINGQVIELVKLDQDGDGGGSNNGGFSEFKLAEPVDLKTGDKIVLWADGDDHGGEFVRIDKIVLKPKEEPPIVDEPCTFRLLNHPDGAIADPGYGLRLDNVFGDGEWTFDFEADGAEMFATVDNGMIHIFGTAIGGRDIGNTREEISVFEIDFKYNMVEQAAGDDDLVTDEGSGSGTISRLDDQGNAVETIDLTDKAGNNPFSFRFGDTDDDSGHRGFDGKSGWGWLMADGQDHPGAQDWLFAVGDKVVIDANDDCIIVMESETFGDLETLEDGSDSILDNDTGADGLPFAGAVFSVDGVEANVGEFIDLADGGRIKINADGTVDFDADGDFEDLDEGEQAMVSVDYTIRLPATTETVERVIDFEGFTRGTVISDQIDGVTISAQRDGQGMNSANDAMIFDSSNPTGGDSDLGTPNQGNILIISEDNNSGNPDDNAHGGTFWVKFDDPQHVSSITFIDTEEPTPSVNFIFADGSSLRLDAPVTGDGGIADMVVDLDNVVQFDVTLQGSGAIDDIVLKDEVEVPGAEDTATVKIKILGEDDTGTISGRYFNDENRDNIENGGDTGVGGATVQLFAQGGTFVASTTTNADGSYTFTDVDPGNYFVRFISEGTDFDFVLEADSATAGADDTNDSDVASVGGAGNGNTTVFSLASGEDKEDVDAGIQEKLGSISGRYFTDTDDDSLDDGQATDPGVAGVTVRLLNADGSDTGETAVTDGEGNYTFSDVPQGDYRVDFGAAPNGLVFVEQNVNGNTNDDIDSDVDAAGVSDIVSVSPGQNVEDVDAGIEDPRDAAIEGRAFIDSNDDSLDDDGTGAAEAGLGDITVTLLNGDGTPTGQSTTTNPDGSYSFTGLEAGDYIVEFGDDAAGRVLVDQDAGDDTIDSDANPADGRTDSFSVGIGETVSDVDAGYEDPGDAAIEGRAFIDSNDDSLDDDGTGAAEAGLGGISVTLLNGDGSATGLSTTTNADGSYSFTGLDAGDYIVEFGDDATGRVLVDQDAGDDTIDSDANPADGRTDSFSVGISETVSDVDAGYEDPRTSSIDGRYFIDQNDNDVDDNEPGLAGVTVTLLNGDGSATGLSTTTGNDGSYGFSNLAAGDYIVEFDADPAGRSFVAQDIGSDETVDSDANPADGRTDAITLAIGEAASDVDAGVEEFRGSISGRFFRDNNRNDVDDGDLGGDFGIGNAVIMLLLADGLTPATDENGDMITAVTNNETGEYRFDNLLIGDYVVKFPQPDTGSAFAAADFGADDTIDSDVTDTAAGTTDPVTVLPNAETADVDAGVQVVVGSISGRYFDDVNRDNIENAGDTGFNAAMVLLFAAGGTTPVDSTMTDANGEYAFAGVTPGDYFVRFVSTSDDFDFVLEGDSALAGADDTNDSDVTSVATGDGDTAVFTLAAGQTLNDVDAGAQVGLGSISGRFFRDNNGNNIDDGDLGGDFGIGNVTIMLLLADGTTPATDENGDMITAVTNAETGGYRFDNLLPGDYVVKFGEAPAGTMFSAPNAGSDDVDSDVINPANGTTGLVTVLSNTETMDVDAGVVPPPEFGSISGRIFNDVNEDGVDAGDLGGEFGVGFRTVELLDDNGNVVLDDNNMAIVATTNESGFYQFDDVLVGDYIVRFQDPTPFTQLFTTPNNGPDDVDSDVIGVDSAAADFGQTEIFAVLANTTTEDIDAGLIADDSVVPDID